MKRKNQLTFCILFFVTLLSAQSDLKLGQWKSHLPYYVGRSITQSESTVYFASTWSIFMIGKDDNDTQFMSKVEGLSDVDMGVIKYVDAHETLIACYENSNIDLVKPTRIVNLPFIKEDPNIVGDKEIYNIHIEGDDLAYLACGFGVVELNVDREEFGFTTKMNVKVNDVLIHDGFIYAATDEGIYRALNNGVTNLQDFGNWSLLGMEEGFPDDYSTNVLEVYEDKLFLSLNDSLFTYENSTLSFVFGRPEFESVFLTAEGSHLLFGIACNESINEDCIEKVYAFDTAMNIDSSGESCVNRSYYAIEDEDGRIWYSDRQDNIRIAETVSGGCTKPRFNSPYTHDAQEMVIDDNDLYITTAKPPSTSTNGFYRFKDGQWDIFNGLFVGALSSIRAAYRIAVHPENKKVYIGTFAQGLWEKDGDNYTLYNGNNTLLVGPDSENPGSVNIGGLAFDENNDLWMTSHSSVRPLTVLRSDGTWQNNFSLPVGTIQDIIVDDNGYKWCKIDGSGQGFLVFDDGDPAVVGDDRVKVFTTSNSLLPSNSVNCLVKDLDGDIWVGTDEGVVVFECGSNVFANECRGSKRIVEVDGFNAFLLETERVQTIAVDGANRKWFGTLNGVFVQSPNGQDRVDFFDEDNSPLFNNQINDIAINQNTGEVFIATVSGVISVRGEAIEGGTRHESKVYAFPNPVRPDYNGPIAIKGLPRDANVKITDIRGQLVYETKALGGQAIWDGNDYTGRKAASGVYLVFSTSEQLIDNPDAQVTKILFMK